MAVNKLNPTFTETQKFLHETIKSQELDSIQNPILKRCAESSAEKTSPEKGIHQAYDRMHHRHNRS